MMRDVVPWLLLLLPKVLSHVALTFPEARYPPFDFLDNSRTISPCGVPKPQIPNYTNLLVGSTYNFTWRMQYPHQGGYRLVLLDSKGEIVEQLAPVNGLEYAGLEDQTIQWERVRFTRPCNDCVVALERQATEWSRNYKFRSCADVNILPSTQSDEATCSGRGTLDGGQCRCENGFTGDICQYHANCERDSDCENGGKCVAEANSLLVKTCFCSYGFFGPNCRQTFNKPSDECFAYEKRDEEKFEKYGMFDPKCFNREKMAEKDFVYYRKIKSDIEIILDFETTSWVSLGWRPEGLDSSCRLFPDLEGATTSRFKRMSMDTPIVSEQLDEEIPPPSTSIRRDPPPRKVAQEGPRPAMPKSNGMLESALSAPMHAMDCVDIVMASVKEGRLRIQDMYSRDRSTPLDDSWFEGELSLAAAVGAEVDGRTVVMFRRNIQEIEPSDHPLGPGRQFVIWAKGQDQGGYTHNAPSAVDGKQFSDKNFYPDDVIKYHGNKNRGIHPIDFTAPVKLPKPNDVAFGVNIAKGEHVHPKPSPEPHPEPEPHDHAHHEHGDHHQQHQEEDSHDEPQPEPEPTAAAQTMILSSLLLLILFH